MALATIAAASAVGSAGAYVDAHYHITGDLKTFWLMRQAERRFKAEIKANGTYSLWPIFEAQVDRLPANEQCLWSRQGCYSWRETRDNAIRYAQLLISLQVQPGQMVALYLQNSPEFIFAMLGAWLVGCAPACLNANLSGDSLIHCLRLSGSRVLLADADVECRQRVEEVRGRVEDELGVHVVVLDEDSQTSIAALEPQKPDHTYRKHVREGSTFVLLYTSGSTGMPKAVAFPAGKVWAIREPRIKTIGIKPGPNGDRWYCCMPIYHGTAGTVAVTCLLTGVTFCIGRKFSVSRFWDDIRDADATSFVYVGETARYLLAAPPSERDKEHKIKMMFGNGLRPDVWGKFKERFGISRIAEFFNSTEGMMALVNVCDGDYQAHAVGHHGALLRLWARNLFVPVQVDIETDGIWRDPKTGFARRASYEEGGEMLVAVANEDVFFGYYKNAEATSAKFERDVFRKGDLYYRTGDALYRTPDGRWFFKDRLGDSYRWKSENVSTTEVAQALGEFPGVVEVIVYGVEVPGHDGKAGCAAIFIAPEARSTFDFARLHAHARANLPRYAIPVFLRVLNDIVPMHNNKQDKVPLRREGIDLAKLGSERRRAATEVDEKIVDGSNDRIMWWPGGLSKTAGEETYVDFTWDDWQGLQKPMAHL